MLCVIYKVAYENKLTDFQKYFKTMWYNLRLQFRISFQGIASIQSHYVCQLIFMLRSCVTVIYDDYNAEKRKQLLRQYENLYNTNAFTNLMNNEIIDTISQFFI